MQLTAITRDAAGKLLSGRAVSWTSDNPIVASVTSTGLVTAAGIGGPVHITAASEFQNGFSTVFVSPPSSGSIGPQGGELVTASGGASLTFSQGVVIAPITVEVRDTAIADSPYSVLSAQGLRVKLPIVTANFRSGGSVQITLPTNRALQTGAVGYLRAWLNNSGVQLWGRATSLGNGKMSLAIPSLGLADFKNVFGLDTLDATFDPEELITIGPAGAPPAGAMSRSIPIGSLPRALEDCPDPPSGPDAQWPNIPKFAPCDRGTLWRMWQGDPGSSVGVVLVHGWEWRAADWRSYYWQQGLNCSSPFVGCSVSPPRTLPGQAVFKNLLGKLNGDLGSVPLFVFNYQSYRDIFTSGAELARVLKEEVADSNLRGFVLIGHSMGGLVSREAAIQLEGQSGQTQVVRGIITTGTPHLGTPLAERLVAAGTLRPFIETPGSLSLRDGLWRAERVPLRMFGGHISTVFDAGLELAGFLLLCYGQTGPAGPCEFPNDGVVPTYSSRPNSTIRSGSATFAPPEAISEPLYEGCNHPGLKGGDGSAVFACNPNL